jgi:hypothetical protein
MLRMVDAFWESAEKVMASEWRDVDLGRAAWGMTTGMRVATGYGWRPVEAVAEGDLVLTFDHGMKPVTNVARQVMWSGMTANPADWPLMVPAGALGNHDPMILLPGQALMIESDVAEDLFGEPFVTVPAAALDGVRGIHRQRLLRQIDVVLLSFAEEQVVFTNCGALFLCPERQDLTDPAPMTGVYDAVPMDVARVVVAGLQC